MTDAQISLAFKAAFDSSDGSDEMARFTNFASKILRDRGQNSQSQYSGVLNGHFHPDIRSRARLIEEADVLTYLHAALTFGSRSGFCGPYMDSAVARTTALLVHSQKPVVVLPFLANDFISSKKSSMDLLLIASRSSPGPKADVIRRTQLALYPL